MATDRVYGEFQWAGVKVATAAKSQVNSDGTDAYARLVAQAASPIDTASWQDSETLTRPNDTTAYGALDVVGGNGTASAAFDLAIGPEAGADVIVNTAGLRLNISAIPTGATSFFLALYSANPPSALVDNAVFNIPSGDRASFLGTVSLGTPVDYGDTLWGQNAGMLGQFRVPSGGKVWAYLVTATGFTPAALSVYVPFVRTVAA